MQKISQRGALHLLLLVASVGAIAMLVFAASSDLKDSVFSRLFKRTPTNAAEGSDIDVTFIQRTPRYNRYKMDNSGPYPKLQAGTESEKKWPDEGEKVSFTANFRNAGDASVSASLRYKWFIDGVEVKAGDRPGLLAEEKGSESLEWNWQKGDHKVKFSLEPMTPISEVSTKNNQLEDIINALSFRLHVDKSVYEKFNQLQNIVDTGSFEDWVQAHMAILNKKIIDSGGKQQNRIDEIVVENDHTYDPGGTHAPLDIELDGRWGFVVQEWCRTSGGVIDCNNTTNNIHTWVSKIQGGLAHEWTHQFGMAHSYDANIDWGGNNFINGRRLLQLTPDIVGICCDDVGRAFDENVSLTPYFIYALDSNLGYRRGYYGDYLFDTPDLNKLKVLDINGNPLPNAKLKIWQTVNRQLMGEPKFTGETDGNGEFILPNQPLNPSTITTATGHTLKANPFGLIDVNLPNGLLYIETYSTNQKDYKHLTVHEFNLQYWRGNKSLATYTLKTSINPQPDLNTNYALNKATRTSSYNPDRHPSYAVDGEKLKQNEGYWSPKGSAGKSGDFWEVDLGGKYAVTKVKVYSSAVYKENFYDKFHIEASDTGSFSGEQKNVATELNWNQSRGSGNVVEYPVNSQTRFLRLTADSDKSNVILQEFEVFASSAQDGPYPLLPAPLKTGYLSDQEYTVVVNGWGLPENNMSNGERDTGDGKVITIQGKTYQKGIGTHAYSELAANLAGNCQSLSVIVGVDDEVGDKGSVVFQVWADGGKLFESNLLKGASPSQAVNISITGKKELKLIVTEGGDGGGYDHADWADAKLNCDVLPSLPPSPSPSPSPTPIPTPQPSFKRVFVTKATFSGNLGGLSGADQKCQAAADATKLGGTWKAWLSDQNTDVSARFKQSSLPYKLLNGVTVAKNWADLTDYSLSSPINITEYNTPVDPSVNGVWTSTMPNGTKAQNSLACNNWTDASRYITRVGGSTNYTNGNWTYWYMDYNYACYGSPLHLYCFEQ